MFDKCFHPYSTVEDNDEVDYLTNLDLEPDIIDILLEAGCEVEILESENTITVAMPSNRSPFEYAQMGSDCTLLGDMEDIEFKSIRGDGVSALFSARIKPE